MSKKCFTLAEVLITLGIVGIVAALTIPNLVIKYQKKQVVSRLKLVYSQLNEAIRLSEAENGDMSGWDFIGTDAEIFEKYIYKYMKVKQTASNINFNSKNIVYKEISGKNETGLTIVKTKIQIYTTVNGTEIIHYGTRSNSARPDFFIDLNGYKQPPNQFGKDMFWLSLDRNRRIYFIGAYGTSEFAFTQEPNFDRDVLIGNKNPKSGGLNYKCSKTGRGGWCGRLIQVDGWQIKNDYPW